MNRPDWRDAPEWASYLAMDRDGPWYWFEYKPYDSVVAWVRGEQPSKMTRCIIARSEEWRETLEHRP